MTPELQYYILSYCRNYFTIGEEQALRRLSLEESAIESDREAAMKSSVLERYYGFTSDITNAFVELGQEKLQTQIAERIYENHKSEIINLCPKCGKLARTPKARQCRHCGYDWH